MNGPSQSARLFHRSPNPPREWLAAETHRRIDAVALGAATTTLGRVDGIAAMRF
jgi:hypothetical protein